MTTDLGDDGAYTWCTPGCTGTGAVGGFSGFDTPYSIDWTVAAPTAGSSAVTFRSPSPFGNANRQLLVNGAEVTPTYQFPQTSGWTTTVASNVTLIAGTNQIKLNGLGGSGPAPSPPWDAAG